MSHSPVETARWLEQLVFNFLNGPDNDLGHPDGHEPAFDQALIGYAAGDDPIWLDFKKGVHPLHWTPAEAFFEAFGREGRDLTVMSWVLPQTEATVDDQRRETAYPSERWGRNRFIGHRKACDGLANLLIRELAAKGLESVVPEQLPAWRWLTEGGEQGLATPWSVRHAAFAAGLGTFGLCDGLITPKGKAMRAGALIIETKLPATPRPYAGLRDYCLYYSQGVCGKCIKRCPAGAISKESGHDKEICRQYLYGHLRPWELEQWAEFSDGPDEVVPPEKFRAPKMVACGLCQAGVPCERGIPGHK